MYFISKITRITTIQTIAVIATKCISFPKQQGLQLYFLLCKSTEKSVPFPKQQGLQLILDRKPHQAKCISIPKQQGLYVMVFNFCKFSIAFLAIFILVKVELFFFSSLNDSICTIDYLVTPFQFPCNSLPKSVQVPFLAYSMERTYNGLTTDLKRRTSEPEVNEKWKVKNGESGFRKNFFAKTLHPYTSTLCNVHYVSPLYGFQIYANPTPTLHQPYTLFCIRNAEK